MISGRARTDRSHAPRAEAASLRSRQPRAAAPRAGRVELPGERQPRPPAFGDGLLEHGGRRRHVLEREHPCCRRPWISSGATAAGPGRPPRPRRAAQGRLPALRQRSPTREERMVELADRAHTGPRESATSVVSRKQNAGSDLALFSGLSAPTAARNVPGETSYALRKKPREGVHVTQTSLARTARQVRRGLISRPAPRRLLASARRAGPRVPAKTSAGADEGEGLEVQPAPGCRSRRSSRRWSSGGPGAWPRRRWPRRAQDRDLDRVEQRERRTVLARRREGSTPWIAGRPSRSGLSGKLPLTFAAK